VFGQAATTDLNAIPNEIDLDAIPPKIVEAAVNDYLESSDPHQRGKLARIILSFSKLSELFELTESQDKSLAMLATWGLATREMEADAIAEIRAKRNGEEYQSEVPRILREFIIHAQKALNVELPEIIVKYLSTRDYTPEDYIVPTLAVLKERDLGYFSEVFDKCDWLNVVKRGGGTVTVKLPHDDDTWDLDGKLIPVNSLALAVVVREKLIVVMSPHGSTSWTLHCFKRGKLSPEWSTSCEGYLVREMDSVNEVIGYPVASKDEKVVNVFFLQFAGFSINTFDIATGERQLTFHSRLPDPTDFEWLYGPCFPPD
jgi:hypothetical protein